jgi:hypothetical protein
LLSRKRIDSSPPGGKKEDVSRRNAVIRLSSQIRIIRQHPLLFGLTFALGLLAGLAVMKWRPADLSGRMGYRDLSNIALSKKTLEVVHGLRALAREMTAADEQIRTRCDKQDEAAKSEPEKNQLRQSCNDESLKAVQAFLVQYEDRYRAEVLIVREEMLYRLPELRHKTVPPILASHPTNALGLGEVASSLEVLAKLLPNAQSKT